MITEWRIGRLMRQLYPRGRAFKMGLGTWHDKLNRGIAKFLARGYDDAVSVLDSLLPDNANFTIDDATDWEKRLGIRIDPTRTLDQRKAAIRRKMSHPGTIKARQHYLYIQQQLRLAGYDVYVYENRFANGSGGYDTQTPIAIAGGGILGQNQLGLYQLGDRQLGGGWRDRLVNYIDLDTDSAFGEGATLRSTFFVGGSTIGSYATMPLSQRDGFRELLLKLKPVQMVGYLFINYS